MPIQSYLMMYFAGAGWQIGKRKVSAIPNDEFNKMSAKQLLEGFTADLRSTIPTLERSLNDITPLIRTLILQYGDFIKVALDTIPQLAQNIVGGQAGVNLQSNIEGFDAILKWIRLQFPGLPEAEAKMMAAQIVKKTPVPSQPAGTVTSPTGQQISIIGASPEHPFQGPLVNPATGETPDIIKGLRDLPPPLYKRSVKAAGQSQKIERKMLESGIIGSLKALAVKGNSNNYRFGLMKALQKQRQDLANLLAWYSF